MGRLVGLTGLAGAAALAVACAGTVATTDESGWGADGSTGQDARADASGEAGGNDTGAGADASGETAGDDAGAGADGGADAGVDGAGDAGGCSPGTTESCAVCATTGTSTCTGGGVWGACAAPAGICAYVAEACAAQCDTLAACWPHVDRSVNPTTGEHFYTTSDAEASCCGFTVEALDYYYLYSAQQSGLVPFYRCLLMSGFHFYTTDSGCEGAQGAKNEGSLGYIATSALCGSTPLYRLYDATNGDHFYTVSASESATAQSNGYVLESTAGYVWTTPE
jgi:hypothetical protein